MPTGRTLVFLKPDAVIRRYTGARLLDRLTHQTTVTHYEVIDPDRQFLANKHYAEHQGRFFYDWLLEYVTTSPLHVLILAGDGVVNHVREQLGDTVPNEASPTSLRGRYGIYGGLNTTHASDSKTNAEREIEMWEPILDSSLSNHQRRVDEYIDHYLDYAQVDPTRYREITTQFLAGEIGRERTTRSFLTLLARESDFASAQLSDMCDVLLANAELERE